MQASFPSMTLVCPGFSSRETPLLPGPESTSDSFCQCSSEGPGTASPLAFSSLALSFDFFFDFFFILFFFFLFLSFGFARFFLLCRFFFVLESLSLESSEEELEEEEDEEEPVDEDAVSEEEVLAFLFFLSFLSFFFSAIHKKRLSGHPPPSLVSFLPAQQSPKILGQRPLCANTFNTSQCEVPRCQTIMQRGHRAPHLSE